MKTRFSQLRDWCSDLLYRLGIGHYSYSQDLTRRLLLEYFLSLSATLLGLGVLEVFCAFSLPVTEAGGTSPFSPILSAFVPLPPLSPTF